MAFATRRYQVKMGGGMAEGAVARAGHDMMQVDSLNLAVSHLQMPSQSSLAMALHRSVKRPRCS
jgi:hypothetical protein